MRPGYIKLWRKIIDNPMFRNEGLLKVWIWCLCSAAYKEREEMIGNQVVRLKPGQFVFKRPDASGFLNIRPTTLIRYLSILKMDNKVDIKSTNKYSIVSITYWEKYQEGGQQNGQQMDNKRTTSGTYVNTSLTLKKEEKKEEEKKEKKEKKEKNKEIIMLTLEKWNAFAEEHSLPKVRGIVSGSTRERQLRARMKDNGFNLDEVLSAAAEQAFLLGDNKEGWVITFDWILKPSNYIKVLEGQYKKKRLSNMEIAERWARKGD